MGCLCSKTDDSIDSPLLRSSQPRSQNNYHSHDEHASHIHIHSHQEVGKPVTVTITKAENQSRPQANPPSPTPSSSASPSPASTTSTLAVKSTSVSTSPASSSSTLSSPAHTTHPKSSMTLTLPSADATPQTSPNLPIRSHRKNTSSFHPTWKSMSELHHSLENSYDSSAAQEVENIEQKLLILLEDKGWTFRHLHIYPTVAQHAIRKGLANEFQLNIRCFLSPHLPDTAPPLDILSSLRADLYAIGCMNNPVVTPSARSIQQQENHSLPPLMFQGLKLDIQIAPADQYEHLLDSEDAQPADEDQEQDEQQEKQPASSQHTHETTHETSSADQIVSNSHDKNEQDS